MSKLSDKKINSWMQERSAPIATSDYAGTKEQLIDNGQLPRNQTVQTTSKDEEGNTTTIWFDTKNDAAWNVPVWRLKIVSPSGETLKEFKATNRDELLLAICRSADEEIPSDREIAYDQWMTSPGLHSGRWFASWRERLCDSDQYIVAEAWKKWLRHYYGEAGFLSPFKMDETVKWVLNNTSEFDIYLEHSKNLEAAASSAETKRIMIADTPHSHLRKVDDTERRQEDVANKQKPLSELRHAAIPALNSSQSSTRDRKIITMPSGTSRKL